MPAPVIRQFVGTIPDKGQSQTAFDTNVDAWLDWTTLQFAPDLVAFGEFASDTRAALVAANLPPLTGRAANMVRVNAAANGVEFRTPAQVLSDISAASVASVALKASVASVALKAPRASPQLTGTPMAPTAAAATNTTQLATTAYTRTAIPNMMNASGSAPLYACRAWVNFNGTGTVAIRASGNVSSITDNGTGSYTVNFTTAMPDTNYATIASAQRSGTAFADIFVSIDNNFPIYTTTAVKLKSSDSEGSARDCGRVSVAIFR